MSTHQYVVREEAEVRDERFFGDPLVSFLYSRVREESGWLYRALTSPRLTSLAALWRFDRRPRSPEAMRRWYARTLGVDFSECADPVEAMDTPRKVFERKIRYWDCRPLSSDPRMVTAPADARMIVGSLSSESTWFIKHRFFDLAELLGEEGRWAFRRFKGGDWAMARLTPDRYHYTHVPASGVVRAIYELDGRYQSCHPAVVVAQATPFSKNRRTVTLLDTDVPGGTGVGLVAHIEIVALMIGDVVQCYSEERYDDPRPIEPGMWLQRGSPKSLFRPGSSTVILLFEPGRIAFCPDLLYQQRRRDVSNIFTQALSAPLVETDVKVRAPLGRAIERDSECKP
jgi:phosphatidylserine decarboxylase